MKNFTLILILFQSLQAISSPGRITPAIRIDQFGYSSKSRKVAVIVDPQIGYNATARYLPGTGSGQYQIRRWQDDAVVFSGTIRQWNKGQTQVQSGDRGWWFDFSAVVVPGSYYVYDTGTGFGSYRFEIGPNVYTEILKQALRTFYYQRCNFPKRVPYADPRWTDRAAFEGPRQDRHARNRWNKENPATERDVSGGWFDAGDMNKYVTNALEPVTGLLEIYRHHPKVFTEDLNLPESGNGIPDLLDEIKFELDWLIKMQDASGTGGLFLKVGSDTWEFSTPPSTDTHNRYFVPECTSATLSGAVVFALAANVYRSLNQPAMTVYAADLQHRAVKAWNRAKLTTSNFTRFELDCDDQNIWAGDADRDENLQRQSALAAAIYLYEATNETAYKSFVDSAFLLGEPVGTGWWGPYRLFIQKALLRYTKLPGVSPTVSAKIQSSKKDTNTGMGLPEYENGLDLYLAYMPDAQYTWGSNMTRAACGVISLDYLHYNINTEKSEQYFELAEQYLHWLHGVNSQGIVMLSNMYAYGGDSCVNEIFHSWFYDGTVYDNARTSSRGPAPGYLIGGPNREFSVAALPPPYNQPAQKAFKDWNTNWNGTFNENSFEITEPAIYYQSMYIQLLAAIIDYGKLRNTSMSLPKEEIALNAATISNRTVLTWPNSTSLIFKLQRSHDGSRFTTIGSFKADEDSQVLNYVEESLLVGRRWYRLLCQSVDGNAFYSNIITVEVKAETGLQIQKAMESEEVIIKTAMPFNGTIQVLTIDGRLVRTSSIDLGGGGTKILNLNGLPRGIYYIQVRGNQDEYTKKIFL